MVSRILMLMSVTSLLAATIALMVKIIIVTISMVSTIALVPMVFTQPTMSIPSALDECAEGALNCNVDATCTNTDGGFECACKKGFTGEDYDVGSEMG